MPELIVFGIDRSAGLPPQEYAESYKLYDLIEVRPVSDKLVVVSASDISRSLETSGRVALYGILFDTNKSDIKPESRAALDEIAKYLRASPNVKLDVVGHTDNVGSYDSNLDLSQQKW